ncbi:uncharacterized protein A1O9_01491 [Exophiala aquamarina CBS 119918]|uniref:Uncharacterized protein n=1 Tax=Exophiala aquamarina CBS 119918 TaxID=1182545 RepID=A0A072PVY2_9EURO|nr:uncharacterized protein A1O9_01491 [Exophiala aquamarina CBS 119918]KEF63513.1 hypothetical protein A1O9_01491 [Exophiala aquamarina CBS 119918]
MDTARGQRFLRRVEGRHFDHHRDLENGQQADSQGLSFFLPQTPEQRWSKDGTTIQAHPVSGSPLSSTLDGSAFDSPHQECASWPLTEKYYSLTGEPDTSCPRGALIKTIVLPTAIVIFPMTFLVAGLLGLIFGYRVQSELSLFTDVSNSDVLRDHSVVLVNYSATRIVFVASWASTLAPLLAGFVMTLDSFRTALVMFRSSSNADQANLPTPYQYSLLVGLCLASIGRLRRYFSYSGEDDVLVPPILRRAARTLTLTLFLACVVFAADTVVHYSTSTIAFDQISISNKLSYGRALSEECLTLSRFDNLGLPCSRNGITAVDDYDTYVAGQNEIFFLNHDTSSTSKIMLIDSDSKKGRNSSTQVALLIPQPSILSPFRDFRAETAGVVMTCEAVTNTQCNWTDGVLGDETFSQFNCSDNFFGILGKIANFDDSGHVIEDPNVPILATKPGSVIQYAYFQDPDLNIPYDSVGDLGTFLEDSQLINPVYVAIAARFATISQRAGVDMTSDPGIHHVGTTANLDLVLNCQYTTYAVDYSWVNSTARVHKMVASPNGTIAEIFHGYNLAGAFSSFDNNLADLVLQAALSTNSSELADTLANGYAKRIMSVIGPFLSPRENLEEQTRTPILVAKVPKAPLALLISCCLAYVIFGITAATFAYRSLRTLDVRDLAFRFSLPALGLHAFRDPLTDAVAIEESGKDGHRIFEENKIRAERVRVGAQGTPQIGFQLRSFI